MNHPMAYVHPTAILGENVTISPFASVYEDVEIGDGTWIGPNVTIMPGSRIGKNCKIYPGTVISGDPQDLKYEGEKTLTYIGDNTTIRECVTVNKGTNALGYTKIGDNCLIMATAHIAHDCVVGNNVVIVNAVGLAGHIEVGDYAFIGGYSAVHQFTKIGEHAFIAGATQIRKDVPPYVKAAKNPVAYAGVNAIGLRRKGFTSEEIYEIQGIYRILYQQKNNVSQAVEQILEKFPDSHYREIILNFINTSDRGIMKGYSSGV
ncbi:UDP-N-acetylglucosamine acyltransferase [Algoriella xinjiangensis]|uniref:UDP-N-acetylglucosamine acyltransferase n=1 Tax=Algoriella xinjiangensis TaxID=684065 RepID=A0A1I4XYS5_9FLAO|nr:MULTISPECIES: acyl-ACP--UDP-N-acetylglucosamine O-acyltransferase [Algoriella]MBO6212654.1 acyl-ACP--UDP-N-acetylglucosamine O-acyltransferase [Algoriella sp.]SFN31038.1 UDP-N-acetylglucosamine acyltransferase [Algoriella xinjiangensis]VDH15380.1 Acyl-[acyl-carrier-protein]--UDP-N-acetylglucosamine O-acyltransferase [Algoriella xinjiangensis]